VVVEGQNATLRAVITNCTGRSFSGSLETFGRLMCAVVDPILTPVWVPSASTVRLRMVYRAPDCTGQGFITGRLLNHSGRVISMKVATVTIVAPPLILPGTDTLTLAERYSGGRAVAPPPGGVCRLGQFRSQATA
jgi:hypothetical protein